MTTGMVGADLANLVNEAALLAARRNLDRVNMRCFYDALDRIQLGAERPLVLTEEDLRVVAIHEAGHALVGLLTPHSDPVTKVTIVPRGQALGVTQYTPMDDRYNYSKRLPLRADHDGARRARRGGGRPSAASPPARRTTSSRSR